MYFVISLLVIIIILMAIKIYSLKLSAKELSEGFKKRLEQDSNQPLFISSRDKDMAKLAETINEQLFNLRKEHLRYTRGDRELKTAITNVSHDIRTPLTAICGYLDMISKTDNEDKRSKYISIIKERASLMKQLTEELFHYSMMLSEEDDIEMENVFVNRILAESISSFYPALTEKGIEPKVELTDKRIERKLNQRALSRFFSNLLNNAVKYSDGDLEIKLTDSGRITFSNTSKALRTIDAEQLFDRFFTVETAHNSTGLGLSIARSLVAKMGGTISADYSDSKLTFTIEF